MGQRQSGPAAMAAAVISPSGGGRHPWAVVGVAEANMLGGAEWISRCSPWFHASSHWPSRVGGRGLGVDAALEPGDEKGLRSLSDPERRPRKRWAIVASMPSAVKRWHCG